MKVLINKNKINIYLNYLFFENKPNLEIVSLEEFSNTIVTILKNKYNTSVSPNYDFNIYENLDYGIILEIIQDENDDEIFLSFEEKIININYYGDTRILYLLHNFDAIDEKILKENKLIYNDNKIYLELKKKISKKDFMLLIEHSDIIYEKEDIKKILK